MDARDGANVALYLRLYSRDDGEVIFEGCFQLDPSDPRPPYVQWWTQESLQPEPEGLDST